MEKLLILQEHQPLSLKQSGAKNSDDFSEPMTALNPVQRVVTTCETFELHFPEMSKKEIEAESIALLEKVGIPSPGQK